MKEKIIAAIKAKFPGINLSNARLNALAVKIEAKLDNDENKIDDTLDLFNDVFPFADIAKQDDAVRNAKNNKPKTPVKKDEDDNDDQQDQQKPSDSDTPAWVKGLFEDLKSTKEMLAQLQGEKVAGTVLQKATARLKDVPQSFWRGREVPKTEDGLEDFVTQVTNDYTDFKSEATSKGLGFLGTARVSGAPASKEKATDKELDDVMKNISIN